MEQLEEVLGFTKLREIFKRKFTIVKTGTQAVYKYAKQLHSPNSVLYPILYIFSEKSSQLGYRVDNIIANWTKEIG